MLTAISYLLITGCLRMKVIRPQITMIIWSCFTLYLLQAVNVHPDATWLAKPLKNECVPKPCICDLQSYSEIWRMSSQTQTQIVCRRMHVALELPCNKWPTKHFLAIVLHHSNLHKYLFKTYSLVWSYNNKPLS